MFTRNSEEQTKLQQNNKISITAVQCILINHKSTVKSEYLDLG